MRYIVDRIEGMYAVCEDENRRMQNIPLYELPPNIKEDDSIIVINGKFEIDKRKRQLYSKMNTLWKQ